MQKYAVIEKNIGETPLEALERSRKSLSLPENAPIAYAGRLDPMASGKLLLLIGDECKKQKGYHALDKEYEFSVLFGVSSDTGDTLGLLTYDAPPVINEKELRSATRSLSGTTVTLPYPHFSSKTVKGKPLHVWTLEDRLNEIEIPTITSRIHKLKLTGIKKSRASDIRNRVFKNIDKITTVTEESKALGRDFRRNEVKEAWDRMCSTYGDEEYTIATFTCIASSGTYMRSLAEVIGARMSTRGLAHHIHRKTIGRYLSFGGLGFWTRRY